MLNIDYLNLKGQKIEFLITLKECEFRYNTKTAQKLISETIKIDKRKSA